jgi:fatty-acyl-CoA synthase
MHVPLTPLRCLRRALDLYPDKPAIVSGESVFTYAEFALRCRRLAAGLRALGLAAGDRAAYLSFNTSSLLEGYFGVPLADGVVLPLNVRQHPAEISRILRHAAPRVLLFEAEFLPVVEQLRGEGALAGTQPVAMDGSAAAGIPSLAEVMDVEPLPERDIMTLDEDTAAELFYTSGSTGAPKGVMLSHRALYLHALGLAATLDHDERQVVMHTIPLFHANGWGFPQFATMCGMSQVMVRRFEPTHVLELIERHRGTAMILVPTMAAALLACPARQTLDLSSLRSVIIGGAAASKQLIAALSEAFPSARCFAGYGLSEASPVLSVAVPRSRPAEAAGDRGLEDRACAGTPLPIIEARVVDEAMQDVPRDMQTIGEIVARGDSVMEGYYREPELTAAVISDGWLHTGDMAVWDTDGTLHIVDRKKDIIISGGENIPSTEIEEILMCHPAVAECAVVAAPHPRWGEVPAAILCLRAGHTATAEEILAFAAARTARFKVPHVIRFQTEPLPKTGTGKVMKRALREQFWQGHERRVQG